MIIYLHGFNPSNPGSHEKVPQLQLTDPDIRLIGYNTRHPKHGMQHLLKEVGKMLQLNVDERPLIYGVGLGDYWIERVGLLCDIHQAIFNPNLFPCKSIEGRIDRPEEYADIATKCVTNFYKKNHGCCLVILSCSDETLSSQWTSEELHHYYEIVWDEEQMHRSKDISPHLQHIKAFKTFGQMSSSYQVASPVPDTLRILQVGQDVPPHPTVERQCLMHLLSGPPNALHTYLTLYHSHKPTQIVNSKLYLLVSPGKVVCLFSSKT